MTEILALAALGLCALAYGAVAYRAARRHMPVISKEELRAYADGGWRRHRFQAAAPLALGGLSPEDSIGGLVAACVIILVLLAVEWLGRRDKVYRDEEER
jgi:hypothetical protein